MSTSSNSNSIGRRRHDSSLLSRSALDSPNPRGRLADRYLSPSSLTCLVRAVHTSALLERISRLQSRLNERVMLAGRSRRRMKACWMTMMTQAWPTALPLSNDVSTEACTRTQEIYSSTPEGNANKFRLVCSDRSSSPSKTGDSNKIFTSHSSRSLAFLLPVKLMP